MEATLAQVARDESEVVAGPVVADLRGHCVEEVQDQIGCEEEGPAGQSRRSRNMPLRAGSGDRRETENQEYSWVQPADGAKRKDEGTEDCRAGNEADRSISAGFSEKDGAETIRDGSGERGTEQD